MKSALLALLLLAPAAIAQTQRWDAVVKQFDAYMEADKVVGGSILYLRDGKVVAQHDLGFADRAANKRVDANTIFHWGSITKALTAIAILQLRDEGKLTLDDKATRFIPELRRVHDPYGKIDDITLRMLLNHTAGFQGSTWPYDKGLPWEPFEPTEWSQLVAMMPYEQLGFAPGEKYSYSNPAFVYLGRIVEQLTGDPWDGYVYKNIFQPLGLQRSYFRNTPRHLRAYRSHNYEIYKDGHVVDRGSDFDPGITTPNGGWNAPLSDLARHVAFLTGRPANDVVLKRASLEEMWKPGKPMNEEQTQWMGLSFFVIKHNNSTLLGHTGGQAAFRAFFYFNPATSAAVIAAFNSTNEEMAQEPYTALRNLVYDLLAN
ncbi:MAG TPA: serine hydrolase domain-containing protein [Thermoanaerobaculia bacterium]|nr:serine hydrolase domain-containing protein [Thermoanaerobaculia bacterium]